MYHTKNRPRDKSEVEGPMTTVRSEPLVLQMEERHKETLMPLQTRPVRDAETHRLKVSQSEPNRTERLNLC